MRASDVTFERMMIHAKVNWNLTEVTSFIQVEFGIKELLACWGGFVDTSDNADLEFASLEEVCGQFAEALADYIEYICEPTPR